MQSLWLCAHMLEIYFMLFLQVEHAILVWFMEESYFQTYASLFFNVPNFSNGKELDRLGSNHNYKT